MSTAQAMAVIDEESPFTVGEVQDERARIWTPRSWTPHVQLCAQAFSTEEFLSAHLKTLITYEPASGCL